MARFKYVGEDARLYPSLGFEVDPSDEATLTHDLDAAPTDGRWKALDEGEAAVPVASPVTTEGTDK